MKAGPTNRRQPSLALFAAAVMTLLPGYGFAADSLTAANADLQVGRADDAVAKLNEALKSDPKSSEANNLLCRVE